MHRYGQLRRIVLCRAGLVLVCCCGVEWRVLRCAVWCAPRRVLRRVVRCGLRCVVEWAARGCVCGPTLCVCAGVSPGGIVCNTTVVCNVCIGVWMCVASILKGLTPMPPPPGLRFRV